MDQTTTQKTPQFIIRIGDNKLAFASCNADGEVIFTPYECRMGISIATNLREAFKNASLMRQAGTKATVIIDSPTLLVPLEEYDKDEIAEQYSFTYPDLKHDTTATCVMPSFKNVVAFGIQKDLMTVLNDNFEQVKVQPLMLGIWEYLLQRSYHSSNKQVYAYFHDGKMEVCSFNRNRFSFCNTFEVPDIHDAMYYLLGVWKNLGCNALADDLFLCGNVMQRDVLTSEMKQFIRRVYYINPAADFNRAPATQILNMPFDLVLEFVK